MRFFAILFLGLFTLSAQAVDVLYRFKDLTTQPVIRKAVLTPLGNPVVVGDDIIVNEPREFTNIVAGALTVPNVATPRYYRVEMLGPKGLSTITNFFPAGLSGTVNAKAYIVTAVAGTPATGYTHAQADARFVLQTGGTSTGQTLTSPTISGATVTGGTFNAPTVTDGTFNGPEIDDGFFTVGTFEDPYLYGEITFADNPGLGKVWTSDHVGRGTWQTPAAQGVTSVAVTAPAEFSITGSPITTAGTVAIAKANQAANRVWAGPTTGANAQPTFRALVSDDLPTVGTPGTYPKVTVDSRGRVASGSALSAGDIPDISATYYPKGQVIDAADIPDLSGTYQSLISAAEGNIIFYIGGAIAGDSYLNWDPTTRTLGPFDAGYGSGTGQSFTLAGQNADYGGALFLRGGNAIEGDGGNVVITAGTGSGGGFIDGIIVLGSFFNFQQGGSGEGGFEFDSIDIIDYINGPTPTGPNNLTPKDYVDYGDAQSQANSEAYADGAALDAVNTANAYTDTETAAAIVTANAYTDTETAAAIVTANAYTESRLVTAAAAIAASAIDWDVSNVHTKTLAANTTFTFSNSSDGQTIVVKVTNGAGNTYTVSWPASVEWPLDTAPTQSTNGKSDVYTFLNIGGTVYGSYVQEFIP